MLILRFNVKFETQLNHVFLWMKWNLLYCLCQPFIMDTFCGGRLQYKWFLHRDFTPNMVSQRSNWDITTLQTIPSHCLAMAFADYTGPLPKGEGEDSVGGGGGAELPEGTEIFGLAFLRWWSLRYEKCLRSQGWMHFEIVFQKNSYSRSTCLPEELVF